MMILLTVYFDQTGTERFELVSYEKNLSANDIISFAEMYYVNNSQRILLNLTENPWLLSLGMNVGRARSIELAKSVD